MAHLRLVTEVTCAVCGGPTPEGGCEYCPNIQFWPEAVVAAIGGVEAEKLAEARKPYADKIVELEATIESLTMALVSARSARDFWRIEYRKAKGFGDAA